MDKASRLKVLAENTLVTILERNRCKNEGINHETHDATIAKNLDKLTSGIRELEQELSTDEQSGTQTSNELKEREDTLIKLTEQAEKLQALMQENNDISARELLLGLNATQEPSTSGRKTKTVRFKDQVVDPDLDNAQVVQLQQRMMEEQDEDLDRLDAAIGRQRELGIMIGEELDHHIELLNDTEEMADRSGTRLDSAKRRLSRVSRRVKENGHLCIIIGLSLTLFVLVFVLR